MNRIEKISVPKTAESVLDALINAGFKAYIIGESVRDILLGKAPTSFDVATDASKENVGKIFSERKFETAEGQGNKIKTEKDGFSFCFSVGYASNPAVVNMAERDFTINAVAYSPSFGLVDVVHGRDDLASKTVRTVDFNPDETFARRPLSMLTALRLSAEFGFSIDPKTADSIRRNHARIGKADPESVGEELAAFLVCPASAGLISAFKCLFFAIVPELRYEDGFDQHSVYHNKDILGHSLAVLASLSKRTETLCLAALLHDVGKPSCFTRDEKGHGHFYDHEEKGAETAKAVLSRLRYGKETIDSVYALIVNHGSIPTTPRGVRRSIIRIGQPLTEDLFVLGEADANGHAQKAKEEKLASLKKGETVLAAIEKGGAEFTKKKMKINGKDLIKIGFLPSPAIGKALDELFSDVVGGKIPNERVPLKREARAIFKRSKSAQPKKEDAALGEASPKKG
jgi:tRNA nucleotidyltransferase (CCA-adding enzyme)